MPHAAVIEALTLECVQWSKQTVCTTRQRVNGDVYMQAALNIAEYTTLCLQQSADIRLHLVVEYSAENQVNDVTFPVYRHL